MIYTSYFAKIKELEKNDIVPRNNSFIGKIGGGLWMEMTSEMQ